MGYIIAIDGPAGAGKSTVAKMLAKKLNYIYVDSGAMYRAFTLKILDSNVNVNNENDILNLLKDTEIEFKNGKIFIDSKDVSQKIRSSEVDKLVSKISAIPAVRQYMIEEQRKISANENIVMDGRDIGTVVFPNANLKIFLTASAEERAKRRTKENIDKGLDINYTDVLLEINMRDNIDTNREISPLRIAEDAVLIDTTKKTAEEVVNEIISLMEG